MKGFTLREYEIEYRDKVIEELKDGLLIACRKLLRFKSNFESDREIRNIFISCINLGGKPYSKTRLSIKHLGLKEAPNEPNNTLP